MILAATDRADQLDGKWFGLQLIQLGKGYPCETRVADDAATMQLFA
jgi:hypothetical protein